MRELRRLNCAAHPTRRIRRCRRPQRSLQWRSRRSARATWAVECSMLLSRVLSTHRKTLLIGTDVPALDRLQLRRAACLLDSHAAVFVPAIDGGYVLVGLAQPIPALFENIDWSTERVMAQTRERLSAANHVWAEMPALPDIDLPADLCHVPKEWLIPIPSHDIPWTGAKFAQLRVHRERIALGIWVNLFHASQHASMMSS